MKLVDEINQKYGYTIREVELEYEDGCGYKEEADYIMYELFSNHDLYDDIVMEFKEKYDLIDGFRACQLFSEEMVTELDCDALYYEVKALLIEMIDGYKLG